MFKTALKAGLPMISVKTDDMVNAMDVLSAWAGVPALHVEKLTAALLYQKKLFVTEDDKLATVENWRLLKDKGRTLVFLNTKHFGLAVECGYLMPTDQQMAECLNQYVSLQEAVPYKRVVKGMTLKSVDELLMLTSAMYGDVSVQSVKSMRVAMGQTLSGLFPMEVSLPYYEPLPDLQEWVEVNRPYFLSTTLTKLTPRGLLFDGPPGTGKTMAAMYLAKAMGVPLFRVDTATTLTKYIGESEGRLAQSLALIDREAPCIALFDEIDKIFSTDQDSATIQRMLSQMLWWMNERRAPVIVIMTSNHLQNVPFELYRPGRIDRVITIKAMDGPQATAFSRRLLTEMLGGKATLKQLHWLSFTSVQGHQGWTHAEVTAMVIDAIKRNKWIAA